MRGFKPFYWLYNLAHRAYFSSQISLLQYYGIKRKYWQSISHKDMPIEEPFQPRWDVTSHLTDNPIINKWKEDGYVVLQRFIAEKEIDRLLGEIGTLHKSKNIDYNYTGTKMVQVHKYSEAARSVMTYPPLMAKLSTILDRNITPFHSIYFNYGSEQAPHSDNIHMATFPKGFLIAAWVALEDIYEGSGELLYYPGSHRLPYIFNENYSNNSNRLWIDQNANDKYEKKIQSLLESSNLEGKTFLAKKGDVLIWHANLIHGGSAVTDRNLTRKSIVFHYFAEGVLCYHEISQRLAAFD